MKRFCFSDFSVNGDAYDVPSSIFKFDMEAWASAAGGRGPCPPGFSYSVQL